MPRKEEIKYLVFKNGEILKIYKNLFFFLLSLHEEKNTLFLREYSDREYQITCRDVVVNTKMVVVAFEGDEIAGVAGVFRPRAQKSDILSHVWPFHYLYTVVKTRWQNKGIGFSLSQKRIQACEGLRMYLVHRVLTTNAPMRRIIDKLNVVIIDEAKLAIGLKPCKKYLNYLIPVIKVLYKIKKNTKF
jgi:hypothetical protein